jgi:tetratricopeptide (TPR) repeat protein
LPGASLAAQTSRPDALAAYNTGRDLESRGRTDEAERYYRDAVRICNEEIAANVGNADTYAVLTWTLQRQRKYNEVISSGERSLRLGNDLRVIETMGEAYFYLGNYDASRKQMERYVNALPQGGRTAVAYFFMGEIFRLQGNNLSADIAYTTALHLEGGSSALWWFRLGTVREAARDYRAAVTAYESAVKLGRGADAADGLARCRRLAG